MTKGNEPSTAGSLREQEKIARDVTLCSSFFDDVVLGDGGGADDDGWEGGSRRRALKKFRFSCVVEDVADEIRIDQLIVGSPNVRLFGWCWWTARGRRKKMHRDRPFFLEIFTTTTTFSLFSLR